ncbi:MAG: radical SAM protein [Candidatus Aureabacteria bacterium]|nr:radical SAM protein [Candidatus Auribacterota bacterium]NLW93050.1 radical SAM protein [Chlamydiota bacterium]HQM51892.1 radical SAM protein [bacterium]
MERSELACRAREALAMQSPCRLCPRRCGARRAAGERGACGEGAAARVYRAAPHRGEEPPLSGVAGSGTVFFSGCTLRCVYCQNHPFSQGGAGEELSAAELAGVFLALQAAGCHNLNLVTPTHVLPQILQALERAVGDGFALPVVYNTSGYETPEALRLLDGVADIYLPDLRYADGDAAARYSGAADYPAFSRRAVREMWRQVGPLATDAAGIARRGLIVRHLVLPGGVAGTGEVMRFLAEEVSRDVRVSLMRQYTPCFRAVGDPVIGRRVTRREFDEAVAAMRRAGLSRGWVQEGADEAPEEFLGESLAPKRAQMRTVRTRNRV